MYKLQRKIIKNRVYFIIYDSISTKLSDVSFFQQFYKTIS
jgi:hypothetical protein